MFKGESLALYKAMFRETGFAADSRKPFKGKSCTAVPMLNRAVITEPVRFL